ncbi:GntR family transcriptional regulator [Pararhodobacter sp. SW119]|uniref:GntR family transcriptional regulator n=1 Tax=Pararhodobacter sp. SW119 TaxID=2780075 RepID=UPI001AE0B12D|nr:GntR family transcriptional regulator [Pararhodobacter sp. SW119]
MVGHTHTAEQPVDLALHGAPPPRYEQIADELASEIAEGRIAARMKLPSEHALMRIFDVSRVTVRSALSLLDRRGLIESRQGAGHFVRQSGNPIRQPTGPLSGFRLQAERHGYRVGEQILGLEQRKATSAERLKFGALPPETLWELKRLRLLDSVPAVLQTILLPADVLSQLDPTELRGGLYACLDRRGLRPHRAEDIVDAIALSPDAATRLCLPVGSPVFRFNRVASLQAGRVIEVTQSLVRSDLLKIVLTPGEEGER